MKINITRYPLVTPSLVASLSSLKKTHSKLDVYVDMSGCVLPEEYLKYHIGRLSMIDNISDMPHIAEPGVNVITLSPSNESDFLHDNDEFPAKSQPARPDYIVLVTGCFDLIHPGHIRLIEIASDIASSRGVPPFVGALNSAGINNHKKNAGKKRPYWSEEDRYVMLRALRGNPYVLFFEGPDSTDLIRELKPDYYLNDIRDFSREIIQMEAELVKSLGGKALWADTGMRDLSSSIIIDKLCIMGRSKN